MQLVERTPKYQFPTPKDLDLAQLASWELEVGDWELTLSFSLSNHCNAKYLE